MGIIFNFNGQNIEYKEGLKSYFQLKTKFDNYKISLFEDFSFYTKDYNDASNLFENANSGIESFVQSLISKLSEYDIYDRTVNDLLSQSKGYTNFNKLVVCFTESLEKITNTSEKLTKEELAKAEARAESNIQGLGFSVYSSNLAAHMLYAAQENRELKRQMRLAENQYQQESEQITNTINTQMEELLIELYDKTVKTLFSCVSQCIDDMFFYYCSQIEIKGAIDTTCKTQMNDERASELLKNIDTVKDKCKLIANALKYSPFDLEIYNTAMKYNLFNEQLIEIINYFEINDSVFKYLVSKNFIEYDYSLSVDANCINNHQLFSTIVTLKKITMDQISYRFTKGRYQKYIDDCILSLKKYDGSFSTALYISTREKFNDKNSSFIIDETIKEFNELFPFFHDDLDFFNGNHLFIPLLEAVSKDCNTKIISYRHFVDTISLNIRKMYEDYDSWLSTEKEKELTRKKKIEEYEQQQIIEKNKKIKKAFIVSIIIICVIFIVLSIISFAKKQKREESNDFAIETIEKFERDIRYDYYVDDINEIFEDWSTYHQYYDDIYGYQKHFNYEIDDCIVDLYWNDSEYYSNNGYGIRIDVQFQNTDDYRIEYELNSYYSDYNDRRDLNGKILFTKDYGFDEINTTTDIDAICSLLKQSNMQPINETFELFNLDLIDILHNIQKDTYAHSKNNQLIPGFQEYSEFRDNEKYINSYYELDYCYLYAKESSYYSSDD